MDIALFAGKVGAKVLMNLFCPGSGSLVDFSEAVFDLCSGNYTSASINFSTGVYDVISLGYYGVVKEAAKGSAKQAAINMAKQASKASTKKIGEEAAKKIAQGAPKKVIVEVSKIAAGRANKEVGIQLGKELARGVMTDATEEAFKQSSKTVLLKTASMSILGSSGKNTLNALIEGAAEGTVNKFVANSVKLTTSSFGGAAASAAKSVANDYLKDRLKRDLVFNSGKGIVNHYLK